MKKILFLFAISLIFTNCNKEKNQIPDAYSFLMGKWRCVNCMKLTEVEIKNNSMEVNKELGRSTVVKFNNVREEKYHTLLLNEKKNIYIDLSKWDENFIYISYEGRYFWDDLHDKYHLTPDDGGKIGFEMNGLVHKFVKE